MAKYVNAFKIKISAKKMEAVIFSVRVSDINFK